MVSHINVTQLEPRKREKGKLINLFSTGEHNFFALNVSAAKLMSVHTYINVCVCMYLISVYVCACRLERVWRALRLV